MASLTNKNDAGVKIAFKCEGCVLDIDVAAVCAKSDMIKAIKAMVDAALTDSSNARIIITDHAHTLLLMLEYIYLGHYNVRDTLELPTGLVYGKDHPAVSHIRVHAFGKKYKVSGLAALALEKLRCSESYIAAEDFVDVLRVAYQYSAEETGDVRTDLLAVALARFDDLAASQVILTQLAEFEELRDFAAQLLPHVSKFAAVRLSKSDGQNARLEKLLMERSKQLEVATAKIAELESASSLDPAQSEASETGMLRGLVQVLKTGLQNYQTQFYGSEAKIQRLNLQISGGEGEIQNLQTQVLELRKLAASLVQEREEAREKLREAQGKLRNAQGKLHKDAVDAADAANASIVANDVIDLVERVDHCRHCGEPQDWSMEWDGSDRAGPTGLTFRCGDCTTRHW
ncbi:hypothetical protein KC338_g6663 [Hortaea werneckii]|nr:hypothetical protein KC338_g6663 [Hortaea werneckii]KAI7350405.1 hypothetical protein KC320_g5486 [Hortaea werneckii]